MWFKAAASLIVVMMVVINPFEAHSAASTPDDVIVQYAENGSKILDQAVKNNNLNDTESIRELREKLTGTLTEIVNFSMLTRSALGPQARSVSPEKLNKLSDVFGDLVVRLYYDRLLEYVSGENPWRLEGIKVVNTERRGNKYAKVTAKATVTKEEESKTLPLDFKMYNAKQGWQVYDIVFSNVSLAENYRSQFSSMLANNDIDHLIAQLEKKLENLKKG